MLSDPRWIALYITLAGIAAGAITAWVRTSDRVQRLEEKLTKHLEHAEPSLQALDAIDSRITTALEAMDRLEATVAQARAEMAVANQNTQSRIDGVFGILTRRRTDAS